MTNVRTVAFMTLGCKVNQYETETMEGLFRQAGYRVVPFTESADVYIVNTCSVTMLGEKKSRQLVRRAQRQNEAGLIAVLSWRRMSLELCRVYVSSWGRRIEAVLWN